MQTADELRWWYGSAVPMDHQREDVELHWQQPRVGVFNDLGTGKTYTVAWMVSRRWFAGLIDRVIIAAPSLLFHDWKAAFEGAAMPGELVEFVDARPPLNSDIGELLQQPTTKLLVVITTYAALDAVDPKRATGARVNFVIDEAHKAAGTSAKQALAASRLAAQCKFVDAMTATPEGRPTSLRWFGIVRLLRPDLLRLPGEGVVGAKAKPGSFVAFSSRYLKMSSNARGPRFPVGINQDRLNSDVLDYLKPVSCVRMKRDCLQLPDKVKVLRRFDLPERAQRMMDDLVEEDRAIVDGVDVVPSNALVAKLRCLELTGGWLAGMPVHSGKLEALRGLLDEIDDRYDDPRVIIWASRRLEAKGAGLVAAGMAPDEALHAAVSMSDAEAVAYMANNRVGLLNGAVSDANRDLANTRWVAGEYTYVVAHPQVAGAGMNWQFATATVYYGQPVGSTLRVQSEDRMHRKGRSTVAMYYDLVMNDGPDEALVNAHAGQRDACIDVLDWLRNYTKSP